MPRFSFLSRNRAPLPRSPTASVKFLLVAQTEIEEERLRHLQPAGGLLCPDHLQNHLPAVGTDLEPGAEQGVLPLLRAGGLARPGHGPAQLAQPAERCTEFISAQLQGLL